MSTDLVVSQKVAEARAALSCWTRGQWKAQHGADILAGVVSSLLAEIDRLEGVIHKAGCDFTGGNDSCPVCRRMYDTLAKASGWMRHPDVPARLPFPFPVMVLCPTCGNKRCPRAGHPEFECTNSNEPDQIGTLTRKAE